MQVGAAAPAPVLHYTFDEAAGGATSALDSGAGTAAKGTFVGNATRTTNSPLRSGFALDLSDGSNDWVTAGDPAKLNNLSNLTLTTWINLQGNPVVNDRVVDKLSTNGGFGWVINTTTANSVQFRFLANSTTGASANSTSNVNLSNQWVFLALTYDSTLANNNIRYYSGSTNASVTPLGGAVSFNQGVIANTPNDLRIGSTPATGNDRTPPAWFDDVRVFNVVLSQTDLEAVRLESITSAPTILQQPQSLAVPPGSNATFTVVGSGSLPLSYQWYFGTHLIADATQPSLTLTNVSADQAGNYTVVLTNAYGSATSSVAVLSLATPGAPILVSALASPTRRSISLSFDRPLADSATNLGNFSLTAGLSVLGAVLDASTFTNLMLTTSLQVPNGAPTR
jgi:hypothetical protein